MPTAAAKLDMSCIVAMVSDIQFQPNNITSHLDKLYTATLPLWNLCLASKFASASGCKHLHRRVNKVTIPRTTGMQEQRFTVVKSRAGRFGI